MRPHTRQSVTVAKYLCACGSTIHTSGGIPNPQQWNLISDERFDEFTDEATAADVYDSAAHGYVCENCGRVWIFWRGYDAEPTVYAPEVP